MISTSTRRDDSNSRPRTSPVPQHIAAVTGQRDDDYNHSAKDVPCHTQHITEKRCTRNTSGDFNTSHYEGVSGEVPVFISQDEDEPWPRVSVNAVVDGTFSDSMSNCKVFHRCVHAYVQACSVSSSTLFHI